MNRAERRPARERGFTLIELMIAIVVVAILASIAVPSYQTYMEKARRADAYACLTDAAQRQESFFYQNNSYTTNLAALGLTAVPVTCGDGDYYTLTATADPALGNNIATSYLLTATRAGAQQSDTGCGDLTLNSAGAKGNVNATKPASQCW
jgi:type IV pilus assembly protein PilE